MCGIAGIIDANGDPGTLVSGVEAMTSSMRHRGPDGGGTWVDDRGMVAFGHRRLAIIDPRPDGAQPMSSADGGVVLTFNGEIYNHRPLRRRLEQEGVGFRTSTDTEVLLEALRSWGPERALRAVCGMFAFGAWFADSRTVVLARDRMGEKPMYYGWAGDVLLFGSELKALRSHPAYKPSIDPAAVGAYLRYGHVPAPWSIYTGTQKLRPGAYLTVQPGDGPADTRETTYWSLPAIAGRDPEPGTDVERLDVLQATLDEVIGEQMVADVPLGAFLSGGIDSSLVVATMQRLADRPIRTFTIGFEDEGHNEAPMAKAVAAHLGTDHTELYVSDRHLRDIIPGLPIIYDEPFSDSSQIPTTLISRLTRQHVTVALSGDGGDELFGGYPRYEAHQRYWRTLGRLPLRIRRLVSEGIRGIGPDSWDRLVGGSNLRQRFVPRGFGDRMHRAALMLAAEGSPQGWDLLMRTWRTSEALADQGHWRSPSSPLVPRGLPEHATVMLLDALTYLPDDILVKVDRAAMAASLETRVPLLDARFVEAAWRLPLDFRVRNGIGKWPLRQMLAREVPRELFERPKQGFGVPMGSWLRGPLRPWAEDLLSPAALGHSGLLDVRAIRKVWLAHRDGQGDWQAHVWNVLMLQAWLEEWTTST